MRMSGSILVLSSLLFVLFLVLYLLGRDSIPVAPGAQTETPPSTVGDRDRIRQLLSGEFKREPKKNVALGEGRLRCVVRDSAGTPAPGANVQVTPIDPEADILKPRPEYRHYWEAGVSAAGYVEFRTLPAGAYLISASREGAHGLATVAVAETGAFAEANLVLSPAAPRSGVVRGSAGKPVSGAVVVPIRAADWVGDSSPYRHVPVETDEDGAFSHPLLPSGNWDVLVAAADFAPRVASLPDGSGASIALDTGETVFGEVLRETDGRPLSSVKVAIRALDAPGEAYTGRTNGQGMVSFPLIRPAEYELSLVSDAYLGEVRFRVSAGPDRDARTATPASRPMRVDPLSGTAVTPGDATGYVTQSAPVDGTVTATLVAPPAASIRGRVAEANGSIGVAGITIAAFVPDGRTPAATAVSDQAGYYHLKPLEAGEYVLVAPRPQAKPFAPSSPERVAVAEGEQVAGPAFQAVPEVTITGRVTDAGGAPVAEANIEVTLLNVPGKALYFGAGADGAFQVSGLQAQDQVRFRAFKMGASSPEFGPVTVGPNGLREFVLRASQ